MKLPPVDYVAPTSLPEALALLARFAPDAKVLAGGQSLMPVLAMRLAQPTVLVDINRVREAEGIRTENGLTLGALTRHQQLLDDPRIGQACPVLAEAARWIGHLAIRCRGTVGGSLVHSDPAAELPCVLLAMDGEVELASAGGVRRLTAEEFFVTYLTTAVAPDELLTAVHFPAWAASGGSAFVEVARRHGDFALVSALAWLRLSPDGTQVAAARLVLGGVGPIPARLQAIEAALVGQPAQPATWNEMGQLAAAAVEPEGDLHASAAYRRHLAAVLTRRGLEAAWRRAKGEQ